MAARFDKYDPVSGGYRAPLGFAPVGGDVGVVYGVVLNGSGKLVKSGAADALGVICLTRVHSLNEPVDVMTDGEIVDVALAAGTRYYAGASGAVSTTNTGKGVGWTVEATRLVVRLGR